MGFQSYFVLWNPIIVYSPLLQNVQRMRKQKFYMSKRRRKAYRRMVTTTTQTDKIYLSITGHFATEASILTVYFLILCTGMPHLRLSLPAISEEIQVYQMYTSLYFFWALL